MKISLKETVPTLGEKLIYFDTVLIYYDIDTYLTIVDTYLTMETCLTMDTFLLT